MRDPAVPPARVLVVEDERSLARVLDAALDARGYDVHLAATGRAALRMASELEPDVVVLDLGLPDLHGLDVCREIRRWSSAAIIVLTVDDGESRKVETLDAGADDYVTKPFSLPELLARVRVALRHRDAAAVARPEHLALGDVHVDVGAHRATVRGEAVHLPPKQFALLVALGRSAGRTVVRDALIAAAWPSGSADTADLLRTQIALLRQALGASRTTTVGTVPQVGYRLDVTSTGT